MVKAETAKQQEKQLFDRFKVFQGHHLIICI